MAISLGALLGTNAGLSDAQAAIEIGGLASDSRNVKPGDLFFALAGTRSDGAEFIGQAVAKGAAAIVSAGEGQSHGIPFIREANPRRLLALAAARFHKQQPEICVAVTGTNGKTS